MCEDCCCFKYLQCITIFKEVLKIGLILSAAAVPWQISKLNEIYPSDMTNCPIFIICVTCFSWLISLYSNCCKERNRHQHPHQLYTISKLFLNASKFLAGICIFCTRASNIVTLIEQMDYLVLRKDIDQRPDVIAILSDLSCCKVMSPKSYKLHFVPGSCFQLSGRYLSIDCEYAMKQRWNIILITLGFMAVFVAVIEMVYLIAVRQETSNAKYKKLTTSYA